MEELAASFPKGVSYNVTLDTTDVIHASIDEVMVTFFETTLLVILVIFLFLQNWLEPTTHALRMRCSTN